MRIRMVDTWMPDMVDGVMPDGVAMVAMAAWWWWFQATVTAATAATAATDPRITVKVDTGGSSKAAQPKANLPCEHHEQAGNAPGTVIAFVQGEPLTNSPQTYDSVSRIA